MDVYVKTIILAAVASHLLADFCLQRTEDVLAKQRFRLWAFVKHSLIHSAGVYLFVGLWTLWLLPVVVFVSHSLIDALKETSLRLLARRDGDGRPAARWRFWNIVVDQILHLAVLVGAVVFLGSWGMISGEPYWSVLLGAGLWQMILVFVCGAVLAIFTGGVLIGVVVQPMLQEIRNADSSDDIKPQQRGLVNGGRLIGQLERTLILLFILSGHPAGVGFLIAAKSIFRFGELKDQKTRMEAEYIIIGTMLSFAWALAAAWATRWALGTI